MGRRKNFWSKREKGRQTERLRMYSPKERGDRQTGRYTKTDQARQTRKGQRGRQMREMAEKTGS